jgi:HrpA-like RNA helicase
LKAQVKDGAMRVASIVVCDLIEKLNSFDEKHKESVLIFLPGFAEIFQFIEYMNEFYEQSWLKENIELVPLHSSLNEEE